MGCRRIFIFYGSQADVALSPVISFHEEDFASRLISTWLASLLASSELDFGRVIVVVQEGAFVVVKGSILKTVRRNLPWCHLLTKISFCQPPHTFWQILVKSTRRASFTDSIPRPQNHEKWTAKPRSPNSTRLSECQLTPRLKYLPSVKPLLKRFMSTAKKRLFRKNFSHHGTYGEVC